ncbi:hypothetical protein Hanom_Chr05g00431261 [Helianthus anomalus]
MGFLLFLRLRGAKALRKAAPQRILIVVFDVFDLLCQFQAFHVFLMCVFDDFDESDDEINISVLSLNGRRVYTELLVLNCYIYKFYMILKLSISHCDNLYLKYRSLTDIQFFTALIA